MLLQAGCVKLSMGVESINPRVAAIYNRGWSVDVMRKAVATIEKYRPRVNPAYQFISDNPYETLDEAIENLRFAASLPKPWLNPIFSLHLLPGTALYEQALRDGLITDHAAQVYSKSWLEHSRRYLQLWIRLYRANFPAVILRWMLVRPLVRLMTSRPAQRAWNSRLMRWMWDTGDTRAPGNRLASWLHRSAGALRRSFAR